MSPFSFLKKKKAKVSLCWNTKWVWLSPIDCELLQDNLEITQNTNITLLRFYSQTLFVIVVLYWIIFLYWTYCIMSQRQYYLINGKI